MRVLFKTIACVGLFVGGLWAAFTWLPGMTPAQPVAKTAAQLAEEYQWNRVLTAGEALRSSAREPESVIFEDVRANPAADVICFQYRARNGFGGMTRELIVVAKGKASQARSAWDKSCALPALDLALFQLNRR